MSCSACIVPTLPKGCHNTDLMCQLCKKSRADTLRDVKHKHLEHWQTGDGNEIYWTNQGINVCLNDIADMEAAR